MWKQVLKKKKDKKVSDLILFPSSLSSLLTAIEVTELPQHSLSKKSYAKLKEKCYSRKQLSKLKLE